MPRLPASVIRATREREPVAFWLGTWFGCGLSPQSPGTVGSIGALPVYFLLVPFGPWAVGAGAVALTVLGIFVSTRVARASGSSDPQFVVIDEAAGVLLTLAFAPPTFEGLLTGVVLFRLFDIFKPPPCRWIERRLPPGPGIMLDDTFAALWGAALLVLARFLGWL
ncbi:MAG: phosphatidylglycerophosphatase A [Deltaproteobacteria bacterium HGW-Deltaproteobacteria-20]|jgi:phosphatidylglycerophosphatase A|nr:MAG: phosphatidylglycerophosphatase A [Deltaproteobacteria bacterium HGW-Deltaproteobacteria-20]